MSRVIKKREGFVWKRTVTAIYQINRESIRHWLMGLIKWIRNHYEHLSNLNLNHHFKVTSSDQLTFPTTTWWCKTVSFFLTESYQFALVFSALPITSVCLMSFFTFYHGKSPLNHHLGNIFFSNHRTSKIWVQWCRSGVAPSGLESVQVGNWMPLG